MIKNAIVLLVLFLAALTPASAQPERVLTEDTCISLALNINHDILLSGQNVLFAEQRVKEAKALYWPTVDLNLNGSKFSNDSPTIINSNSIPASFFLPAGNRDLMYSARVSLWQHIYNGGKTSAINNLSKIHLSQTINNSTAKKNEIIAKVKINFYKSIALKEKIKIYKNEIEKLSKNKNRYVRDLELLQNHLEIAEHMYEIQMLDFINLLGLSLDTTVDLAGNMTIPKMDLNLQQCVLWSYQFRPEMKGTQYQESIDGIAVNLLTMEKFPTVVFGASYDWTGNEVDNNQKDWYVSLNLNYPIFDGATLFTKIKQKKIKARQATLERSKAEESIKLEVRKAFSEYEFWYKKVLKTDIYVQPKGTRDIEKEISKIDIQYNYLKSLFELELTVGKQITNTKFKSIE